MVYRNICHWAFCFFLCPILIDFYLLFTHQNVSCALSLMLVSLLTALLLQSDVAWKLYDHIFWVRNFPLDNTFLLWGMNFGSIYNFHYSQSFSTLLQLYSKEESFLNTWISYRWRTLHSEYSPVISCLFSFLWACRYSAGMQVLG